MAIFNNRATLSYNGIVTVSNTVTGELIEALSATKTAVVGQYSAGDEVTYVISLSNSEATAFTNLTVTDNLGAYTLGAQTLTPLTYTAGSLLYYVNGVLQATPAVTAGPPMTITGITVPAGGNAILVYETQVNQYAPLATGSVINNIATISGVGLSAEVTAPETITALAAAQLSIIKNLSPTEVTGDGQITYTFTIQNTGNTAVAAADNAVVTDIFDPILNPIAVTYNGVTWAPTTNYTYNTTTGAFATVAGQITVPAATYAQDPTTGVWTVTPGISTLIVTGTV